MIIELGHFALILALAAAIVQTILPAWGARVREERLMAVAEPAALGLGLKGDEPGRLESGGRSSPLGIPSPSATCCVRPGSSRPVRPGLVAAV